MALDQQNIPTIDIYPTPRPTIAEPGVEGAPVQREGVTERIVRQDGPQVAGGTTQILKAILGAGADAAPPPRINPDAVMQEQNGLLIFRDPTPDEVVAMNRPLVDGQPTAGQPGGNPDVAINLNRIQGPDDILRLYAAFGQTTADDLTRNTPVTFADILSQAEEIPATDMLQMLLQMKPGTVMNGAQIQRARQVTRAMVKKANEWGQRALQTGDPRDLQQAIAYQTLAAGAFKGTVNTKTEMARAMASLRDMVMFNTNAAADVDAWLAQSRTIDAAGAVYDEAATEAMRRQVQLFMALPTDSHRAEFLRRSRLQIGADIFMEHYIPALLSSPVTHMINVLGSVTHIGLTTAERGVAGVVGAARTGIGRATGLDQRRVPILGAAFSNQERVYTTEMLAMLHGLWEGNMRGMRMAWQTLKTEQASDLVSKLEMDDQRRVVVPETFGVNPASPIGKMITYYGAMIRLPGRFLMAEDEYFKGLAGHMETQAQAVRMALDLEREGMPADDAAAAAVGALMRGDGQMGQAAGDFARQITFQDDVPKFFEGMYALQQHPLVRLYMPFFRTPVNVIKQMTYRTPGVNTFPYLWNALQKGGREADIAIARTMTGASLIGGAAMMTAQYGLVPGADIIITGQEPTDKAMRETWRRLGLQAHSFARLQEDGSYQSVSYARLDPISGLLAMGADIAQVSARDFDGQDTGELIVTALNSYLGYAQDLPMLTGMSEIMDAMAETDPDRRWARLTEVLARDAVSAVGTALPIGPGAGQAYVERIIDPAMENTLTSDPSQSPVARGFYEALNRLKARSPFYNDDLPPALNFWGEPMEASGSMVWRAVSPFRIQDGRYTDVDEEFMRLGKAPQPVGKAIDGIRLTGEQQNRMIELMNTVDPGSTVRGHRVRQRGDEGTLLDALQDAIRSPRYQRMMAGEQWDELNGIVSQYRRAAKDLLIDTDPDLKFMLQERELNILHYNRAQ